MRFAKGFHEVATRIAIEKTISEKIGLNVIIKNDKRNKGSITFFHKEIEQLNKIIEIVKLYY